MARDLCYTCGLDNIGASEKRNGRILLRHGSVSYLSAENVRVETEEENGEYCICLKGTMKFTALFGQKLVMRREIRLKYFGDEVTVTDEIANEGDVEERYLLMYYTNIGYPLLDENAKLSVDAVSCEGISKISDKAHCCVFEKPTPAPKRFTGTI